MDYSVAVSLKDRPHRVKRFRKPPAAAIGRAHRICCQRLRLNLFPLFSLSQHWELLQQLCPWPTQ
jgi:hypothetical protein